MFGLPPDVVAASLGQIGVQEVSDIASRVRVIYGRSQAIPLLSPLQIPDDVALGSSECLRRCNITSGPQPTAQQVPRTSGNALPAASPSPSHHSRKVQSTPATPAHVAILGAVAAPAGSGSSSSTPQPVTIALIVVVSVMGLGYLVLAGLFFVNRRRGVDGKNKTFMRPHMQGRSLVSTAEKYDPVSSSSAMS